MTKEQIEELRRLDRAPDGSCWCCKTVMRGHFDGCPVATIPRLLGEREKLLESLRAARFGAMQGIMISAFEPVARRLDDAIAFAEEAAP